MRGLKKHTHEDRQKVIDGLVPLIQKKFGENLLALAAQASFARGEDFGYSDLELIAFVKEMPEGKTWGGMGRIVDGLMVELVWMTRDHYLRETKDVGKSWFISGSDTLSPIINSGMIAELNSFRPTNLREKCLTRAVDRWYEVQEATAKVLNAIEKENREGLPLLVSDMALHMLVVLSFLNQTPYLTFARFIEQARTFEAKPDGMDELLDLLVLGEHGDLTRLKGLTTRVFSKLEEMLEREGCRLYDENVDPNRPGPRGFV